MFPFPFGRHITQMLQLGELLRARGLGVTVLHTAFNAPDPTCHPELTFVSIRESLPADVVACPDMVEQMMALNAACEAQFQAALAEQLARGGHQALQGPGEVACVVVDGQWYKMLGAATHVAVPALALRADGAATFLSMLATPRLVADGNPPTKRTSFFSFPSPCVEGTLILCHRHRPVTRFSLVACMQKSGWTRWCRAWSRSACET